MKPLLFLLLIIVGFSSCKESGNQKMSGSLDTTIAFEKKGELKILKQDSTTIALDIEIADSKFETETGLMYREAMDAKQGMLFIFEDDQMHSFYMKNTKIALDIIYINAEKKIVNIAQNAIPMDETSISSGVPVRYVLEVNAGKVDEWGVEVGNILVWKNIKE